MHPENYIDQPQPKNDPYTEDNFNALLDKLADAMAELEELKKEK